jgi:hypothetical protein
MIESRPPAVPRVNRVRADKSDHRPGNVVEILISGGRVRESENLQSPTKTRRIEPEPLLKAITPRVVRLSDSKYRFSDIFMSVATSALSKEEVTGDTEFIVNGERYSVVSVGSTDQTWEFVIRAVMPPI